MTGGADCKFRAFDAANCMEVQIGAGFERGLSGYDGGMDRGDNCAVAGFRTAMPPQGRPGESRDDGKGYFFACAGGTVSISLPENTGAEVGWPLGEQPACSTVTA